MSRVITWGRPPDSYECAFPGCENLFQRVGKKDNNRKYCDEHRNPAVREKLLRPHVKEKAATKCANCGFYFVPERSTARFCLKCRPFVMNIPGDSNARTFMWDDRRPVLLHIPEFDHVHDEDPLFQVMYGPIREPGAEDMEVILNEVKLRGFVWAKSATSTPKAGFLLYTHRKQKPVTIETAIEEASKVKIPPQIQRWALEITGIETPYRRIEKLAEKRRTINQRNLERAQDAWAYGDKRDQTPVHPRWANQFVQRFVKVL